MPSAKTPLASLPGLEWFSRDLRLAVTLLRKQPGFTVVALLTLALSIGANTAAFSVVEGTLLRPLPYSDPDQLIAITGNRPDGSLKGLNVSFTKLQRIQEQTHTLVAVGATFGFSTSFGSDRGPVDVPAAIATRGLFDVLRVSPSVGRGFLVEEDRAGGANVAIISDGFWHSHFGADASVVGRAIRLDGRSVTVVGILPAAFRFPFQVPEPQVWFPRVFENPAIGTDRVQSGASFLAAVGRLQPGVTIAQAQRELTALSDAYARDAPGMADANLIIETDALKNSLVGQVRVSLLVLFAAVGLVLLIGCSNIAGMLMVRATAREPEIALRRALGASRGQLVRQLLTESLLLSLIGGALGIAIAASVVGLLKDLPAGFLPRVADIHLDAGVLGFSLVVSALAGLLFGLVPSLRVSRTDIQGCLKQGRRSASGGRRGGRVRAVLVVAQVALAVVLVVCAGLLGRSFSNLMHVDPGFSTAHVLTFRVALPGTRYPAPAQQAECFRRLVERVQALPTVEVAAAANALPFGGVRFVYVCPQGTVCRGVGKDPMVVIRQVTPAYLDTMGMSLLRGRRLDDHDIAGAHAVALLSETAAAQLFPGQDPVGRQLLQSRGNIPTDIVGIVHDLRSRGLDNPPLPEMFLPQAQSPTQTMSVVVRSASDQAPLVAAIQQAMSQIDPDVPLADITPMSELASTAVAQPRLTAQLIGAFGALALLLAAIGIHGVLSFAVAQRTQEIGTRVALGATARDVVQLVVGQSVRMVALGAVLGSLASLEATKLISTLLIGTSARDPLTFGAVGILVLLAAMAATYLPARRAAKVDPIIALHR
jgi:putative ABC transport system permease protein